MRMKTLTGKMPDQGYSETTINPTVSFAKLDSGSHNVKTDYKQGNKTTISFTIKNTNSINNYSCRSNKSNSTHRVLGNTFVENDQPGHETPFSMMNSILFADSAGPKVQRLYHQSHYVLAGLLPASLVSETSSIPAKVSDIGLAAAIPLHSHVALNYGTFSFSLK